MRGEGRGGENSDDSDEVTERKNIPGKSPGQTQVNKSLSHIMRDSIDCQAFWERERVRESKREGETVIRSQQGAMESGSKTVKKGKRPRRR